ncbi:hypothetical protein, partial [Rubritalea sp.]|uniref:hypothetical protein n=1 Tax=Rubritalea sp. TaxID=2109375 RepID=UPI003EF49F69
SHFQSPNINQKTKRAESSVIGVLYVIPNMKLSLTKNDDTPIIAELCSHGHLGAHINLRRIEDGSVVSGANIKGYDVSDRDSSTFLDWPDLLLESGDIVKIEINPSDDSTPPSSVTHSSDYTQYQNLSIEDAKVILNMVNEHVRSLNETLEAMRPVLSTEDFRTFAHSVGHTLSTYHEKVERPIYRNHPSLAPDTLRDYAL